MKHVDDVIYSKTTKLMNQVWARGTNLPAGRQAGTQRKNEYKLNNGIFSGYYKK